VAFEDETAYFNLSSKFAPDTSSKVAPPNLASVNLTVSSGPTQDAEKRKNLPWKTLFPMLIWPSVPSHQSGL
jgi:hypothetical protein